jgi:hypothetical protein
MLGNSVNCHTHWFVCDVSSFLGFLALKRRVICPVGVDHDDQKKMVVLQVQFIFSGVSSLQG